MSYQCAKEYSCLRNPKDLKAVAIYKLLFLASRSKTKLFSQAQPILQLNFKFVVSAGFELPDFEALQNTLKY